MKEVTDPALLAELRAASRQQSAPYGTGLLGRSGEIAGGINKGIGGFLDLWSKPVTIPLQMAGANVTTSPFTDLFTMLNAAPRPEQETVLSRMAEPVGGALFPAGAMTRAAATTAPHLAGPLLRSVQANPGGYMASEGVAAASAGAGGALGYELGGETGQAVGELAGGLAPTIASGATRLAFRGGEQGRRRLARNVEQARDIGVELSAGQAGSPTAAATENTLGRMPGGVGTQVRRAAETVQSVQDEVNRISGQVLDDTALGRRIQHGLEAWGERWNTRMNSMYERLRGLLPDGDNTPISINNALEALRREMAGIPGAENVSELLRNPRVARWLRALEADSAETGTIPYRAVRQLRSEIGGIIGNPMMHADEPVRVLRRVYAALSDDMRGAARLVGDDAVDAFDTANRAYKRGATFINERLQKLVDKADPEKIVTAFRTSVKQGSSMVRTLKRALLPHEFDMVRRQVVRELGMATPGVQNAEGTAFSIRTFLTNWARLAPEAKNALFGGGTVVARMRRDLDRVARVAENIKEAEKVLANPSGTTGAWFGAAAVGSAGALPGALASGAITSETFMTALAIMGSTAAASAGTQRLMQSPRFVNWLARSTRVPVGQVTRQIAQLESMIENERDPSVQEAMQAYRASLPGGQ